MRRALLLLSLCLAVDARADTGREALHFVASSERRASAYVGEVVALPVVFAVGEAGLKQQVVPAFQQSTDLPVALTTPWARLPAGVRLLGLGGGEPGDVSLVLDEGVGHVHRQGSKIVVGSDQRWVHYAIWGLVVFDRPGRMRLPPAVLRGALAERFEVDALGRRVPIEVERVVLEDEPIEIEVLPLPDDGRPARFAGAVGTFAVEARLAEPTSDASRSVRVEVVLTGHGDLSRFHAPTADDVGGLHLLGLLEQSAPGRRTFLLDLGPGRGPQVLPPLLFPHYELGSTPGYRVAATSTLPLPMLEGAGAPAATPPSGAPAKEPPPAPKPWWAILALFALLVVMGRVRRRRRDDANAAERARLETLRARLLAPEADVAAIFTGVLAARLGTPPAAVVAPDLPGRLERAGVAPETAREAAVALERLVAARYGGVDAPPGAEELSALAARIASPPPDDAPTPRA